MKLVQRGGHFTAVVTMLLCLALSTLGGVTAARLAAGACPYTSAVYSKAAADAVTAACDTTNLMFGEQSQADYCNTCYCAVLSALTPSKPPAAAAAAAKNAVAAVAKPAGATRNDVIAGVLVNDPKSMAIFQACIDTEIQGLTAYNAMTADEVTGIKNCVTNSNLADRKRMAAACLAPKKTAARLVGRK